MHAPPHRRFSERGRVLAEVVAVVAVDALEQQLDLEPLEVVAQRASVGASTASAGRYRYSHTRSSESSWSVSTGLVM